MIRRRKETEEALLWESAVNAALSELYAPLISPTTSLATIAETILDHARKLTGSAHGYVSAIEAGSGDSAGYTLASLTEEGCKMRGKNCGTRPAGRAGGQYRGPWGHALNTREPTYVNPPARRPAGWGLPKGHVPIERFLSVPVMLGAELVGQIALANARRDYTDRDLKAVARLAEFYALAFQRHRAEETVRRSEQRFRKIFEEGPLGLALIGRDLRLIQANRALGEMLGYDADELVGRYVTDLIYPDDRENSAQMLGKLFDGQLARYCRERRYLASDGRALWVSVTAAGLSGEGSDPTALAMIENITARKESEEKTAGALREKEVLLREIHHRVKNNLQVISSLLRLQAGAIQHSRVLEIFRESQNRVQSVAIVHDLLHRSKDLSKINFAEYARSLAASLMCSYGVSSAKVSLRLEVAAVPLGIDTAISCGLIIHELIANSLKYAFPGGRRGEIRVRLKPLGGGRLRLTVADDGVGFAKGARSGRRKSLGLRLVKVLAEQIGSTVKSSNEGGARFDFEFDPGT